ncbi:hypothetical protein F1880_005444 [Penicillium rolfsii]|nr:hypothetical protein F1880_005444 [Penicillium rolfsii]
MQMEIVYQKTNHLTVSPDGALDPFHEWAIHRLAFKTHEIVTGLKETIRHKTRRSPVTLEWSPMVERMCFHFFSPPSILRYIEAFWVSWYPNCPIVQKPSFNPTQASPLLLASMAIIGSCVLSNKQDNQNAEIWFDTVEEMVFDDESLQEEYADARVNESANGKSKKLETLQAAYLVCLFQNWEGSEITQRRIRRRRYSTVVAVSQTLHHNHPNIHLTRIKVARDLVLGSSIHQAFWLINDASKFDWQAYIQKEETIRTLIYVFLLDSAFVIFHNSPPRIFGQELEIHISCPEAAFQAGSADECFQYLKKWADEVPDHPSVSTTIETICRPETETCLVENSLAPPTAFVNIERGMKNWKNAWDKMHVPSNLDDDNVDDPPKEAWRRYGFMKSAWEYWLLCNVLLGSTRSDSGDNSGVAKRTLDKYDQTDMEQVRQLITQFNAMEMG